MQTLNTKTAEASIGRREALGLDGLVAGDVDVGGQRHGTVPIRWRRAALRRSEVIVSQAGGGRATSRSQGFCPHRRPASRGAGRHPDFTTAAS